MKLIVILGHKDLKDKLVNVFQETRIPVYSQLDILGHVVKDQDDLQSWYDSKIDADYSISLFTFVKSDEIAQKLLDEVRLLNKSSAVNRPFHAYQIDVEQFV